MDKGLKDLYKKKDEKIKYCLFCGKILTGLKRKYCSAICTRKHFYRTNSKHREFMKSYSRTYSKVKREREIIETKKQLAMSPEELLRYLGLKKNGKV